MKLITYFSTITPEKIGMSIITLILAKLMPLTPLLIGTGLLIAIDFATGVRKSLHNSTVKIKPFNTRKFIKFFTSGWIKRLINPGWVGRLHSVITSNGFRATGKKIGEYNIIVITFAIAECYFFKAPISVDYFIDRPITITELAIYAIAAVEAYSIGENVEAVSGRNIIKLILRVLVYMVTFQWKKLRTLLTDKIES